MKTSHGLKVCPFVPEHFDRMVMRDRESQWKGSGYWKALGAALPPEQIHTYIIKDHILFIGGYVPVTESNIEVFIVPSVHVYLYPIAFQIEIKRQLDEWQKQYERIQTHSHDDEDTNRWMSRLGFQSEGLHLKYCRGLTYRTWARVT